MRYQRLTSQYNFIDTSKQAENVDKDSGKGGSAEKNKFEDSKEEEDKSEDVRYRLVLNSLDPDTGEYVDKTPEAAAKKTPTTTSETSNLRFTFRRFMKNQNVRGEDILRSTGSEVDIESVPLQVLLGKITHKYVGMAKVTQMESPYMNLIWSWDEADKEANAEDPEDTDQQKGAREDLRELMKIISTSPGDESLERYFKVRDSMKENGTATFESLWTLFPKGSFIISRPFFNETQVFMVQSCILPDMDDTNATLTVIAYSYDWNGFTFNRVPYPFHISHFPDKKAIFELPFYPLDEHVNLNVGPPGSSKIDKDTLQELEKRGHKFYEYCVAQKGKQTFRYNGPAFSERGVGLFSQYDSDDDSDSYSSRAAFSRADEGSALENSTSAVSLFCLPQIDIII